MTIRQSDYNLCDKCEAVRQEDAQKRKENQAKTTSGQFTVVNSPNVKTREPDAPIPAPVQQCNGPCSTKDGEATCCCFILGPLLFSIYVNDLSNNLTCKTVLYADDTALMYSSDDANDMSENLNNNLSNVGSWLRSNKLSLNVSKTKYMICGTKKRIDQFSNVKLSIDGDDI